jgi:polyphosphate kinase
MERNFFRRIELAFPVLDPSLKKRVLSEGLRHYLADNTQTWEMRSDGRYLRKHPTRRSKPRNAQEDLMALLGR